MDDYRILEYFLRKVISSVKRKKFYPRIWKQFFMVLFAVIVKKQINIF